MYCNDPEPEKNYCDYYDFGQPYSCVFEGPTLKSCTPRTQTLYCSDPEPDILHCSNQDSGHYYSCVFEGPTLKSCTVQEQYTRTRYCSYSQPDFFFDCSDDEYYEQNIYTCIFNENLEYISCVNNQNAGRNGNGYNGYTMDINGGYCYDSPNDSHGIVFGCRDCQSGFSNGDCEHL